MLPATSSAWNYRRVFTQDNENLDFIVERGEKIAFVGKNGEGKTTFSRVIIGELEFSGNLKIGHNVDIGYFAQNQDWQDTAQEIGMAILSPSNELLKSG